MSDDVDGAVAALESSNVYVAGGTSLTDEGAIASALSGSSTAVAVLPADAVQTVSATQLAAQIESQTSGYDVVIVVIDAARDSFGVAGDDATAVATTLNSNNDGDAGPAIEAALPQITSSTSTASHDGGSGSTIATVGGVGLAIVVVGTAVTLGVRRLLRRTPSPKVFERLPEDLRGQIEVLDRIQRRHQVAGPGAMPAELAQILGNSRELFERIRRRGSAQQARIAEVEYTDTLGKLNRALGEDYFLDILAHPQLWDEAEKRLDSVRQAVAATQGQLLRNIRQVNASQDLEFQVALESLLGTMDPPSIDSVYSHPPDTAIETAPEKHPPGETHE
ncbi:MAG: hypothetical protein QM572_08055 [Nocardioides sp.]|uniref:hypothetical protein n=1 Tax=Nocardioides sp. TaxID=35761 RepID=UPI0039E3C364